MIRVKGWIGCAMLVAAGGCAHRIPPLTPNAPVLIDVDLQFDNHAIVLHLSRPCTEEIRPLVVFATGDGGWRGKDRDAWEHLIHLGYPLAGFSAPSYLQHITKHTHATTPADVARDYASMIATAKIRLGLPPETPTILLGVSRGSGLSVAAAGEPDAIPTLAGVVAVALTREEEYVQRPKRRRKAPQEDPEMQMLDTYEYLARLQKVPVSIIQSTHDDYLSAEEARRLLGPDTALHQLHPIPSKNHSFSDARAPLYDQMERSLAWVAGFASAERTP
jgi:type IV secretory pathway VirJ component